MARRPIVAVHANDPGWIIALWLAIHGGDPAPEHIGRVDANRAALAIIRELVEHLEPVHAKAVTAALAQKG